MAFPSKNWNIAVIEEVAHSRSRVYRVFLIVAAWCKDYWRNDVMSEQELELEVQALQWFVGICARYILG